MLCYLQGVPHCSYPFAGKWTGFVTNTRITHGTPAALFSNSASRYWEDDSKLPPKARGKCQDIAAQMIDNMPGKNLRVILGGGRRHLLPENTADPKLKGYFGKRADGRNLMQEWKTQKHDLDAKYSVVTTQKELADVDHNNTDYLLGVFSYSHMNFEMDRDDNDEGEPSLVDMTRRAIQVLKRGPEGFVLMVEAGRMDHAHHFSNARRALDEVHSLDDSVKAALELISPKDTLLIVTGDHSHTMTIGGYPKRGNPILGKDTRPSDVDNMPYTTLLYGNGPGYGVAGSGQDFHDDAGGADQHAAVASRRQDLSLVDTTASDYIQQSAVPRKWETHGGEDVPVYALGPMAHLFRGTFEQTFVPHAAAYAACIGHMGDQCQERVKVREAKLRSFCRDYLNISSTALKNLWDLGSSAGHAQTNHLLVLITLISTSFCKFF